MAMSIFSWLQSDWFTFLQSLGIVGGLIYTARSFQVDAKTRKTENLIRLTERHHKIWSQIHDSPALSRVSLANPNLEKHPITKFEELFVVSLILHLNSAYKAGKYGLFELPGNLTEDIVQFFSAPIPRRIWEKYRSRQDADFVDFVESIL